MELGGILLLVAFSIVLLGLLVFFGAVSSSPFTGKEGLKGGLSGSGVLLVIGVILVIVVSFLIKDKVLTTERYENRHEK
jgi:uncharacterized membrane protein